MLIKMKLKYYNFHWIILRIGIILFLMVYAMTFKINIIQTAMSNMIRNLYIKLYSTINLEQLYI